MIDFLTRDIAEKLVESLLEKIREIKKIDKRFGDYFMQPLSIKETIIFCPFYPFHNKPNEIPRKLVDSWLNDSVTTLNTFLLAGIDIDQPYSSINETYTIDHYLGEVKTALANYKKLVQPSQEVFENPKDGIWD
jgi:hypothetical protein